MGVQDGRACGRVVRVGAALHIPSPAGEQPWGPSHPPQLVQAPAQAVVHAAQPGLHAAAQPLDVGPAGRRQPRILLVVLGLQGGKHSGLGL